MVRGVREGRGGQGREGVQLPDSLVDEAVLQSAGPGLETPQVKSSQVTFIYIALLTIQIVSKHLTVSSWRIECQ